VFNEIASVDLLGGMSKLTLMWVHLLLQNNISVISHDYILPPSYIFLSMGSSYFMSLSQPSCHYFFVSFYSYCDIYVNCVNCNFFLCVLLNSTFTPIDFEIGKIHKV
jgi:hypothetical protein